VWPENWQSFGLLADNQTQWRGAGMGIIGLDYGPIHHDMARMNLSPDDYEQMKIDVRAMEYEALLTMKET
jgi:hypothetical protein